MLLGSQVRARWGALCVFLLESPASLQGLAQEVLDKYYWANAELTDRPHTRKGYT